MKALRWLGQLLTAAFRPPYEAVESLSPLGPVQCRVFGGSQTSKSVATTNFVAHVDHVVRDAAERRVLQLLHEIHEEKLLYMESARRAYHPAGRTEIGLQGKLLHWVWMWLYSVRDLQPDADQLFRAWLEASRLRDQIRDGRQTNFQQIKHLVAEVRMGRLPL